MVKFYVPTWSLFAGPVTFVELFEYHNKHLISTKGKCMKEADMFCQVALEQIFDWMLDVKLKY